jgi:uncharacterized protein
MKPPCMIVVQHILPVIRSAVAYELIEVHGLKKSRVAKLMGLTPAAITQYINRSRGDKPDNILKSGELKEMVSELSRDIAGGEASPDMLVMQMCRMCSLLRSQGIICELHKLEIPQLRNLAGCACGFGLTEVT